MSVWLSAGRVWAALFYFHFDAGCRQPTSHRPNDPNHHPTPQVLGKMPNKTFEFTTRKDKLQPLAFPAGTTPQAALERVVRLPSVGSKRFLTTKVDRHVTGRAPRIARACACRGRGQRGACVVLLGVGRVLSSVVHRGDQLSRGRERPMMYENSMLILRHKPVQIPIFKHQDLF
jgi:hypothetical protein